MRGRPPKQTSMLCLLNVEDRVPQEHPLRPIKALADSALRSLSRTFEQAYAKKGRPSIPPERLLKGMLLIALYSIRSEVQFCEQLRYNLLFRWFIDMDLVEEPFDHSAFSDNRARLIEHDVARMFFRAVVNKATAAGLMSSEHFSVDGTLIEAWASMKSFRPKDEHDAGDSNGWSDFRGEKRSNETHESKSDPEARIFRKGNGKEAKLVFMGHALMENRKGLIKDLRITTASGRAEREAAVEMIDDNIDAAQVTVGADAGYDAQDFVDACRSRGVTPHVAQKKHSAIDGRTTRHAGYSASQQVRKRSEQIFGWLKVIGGMRKTRFKGRERNQLLAYMTGTAYNLLRIAKLMAATG
jgi:transposase